MDDGETAMLFQTVRKKIYIHIIFLKFLKKKQKKNSIKWLYLEEKKMQLVQMVVQCH